MEKYGTFEIYKNEKTGAKKEVKPNEKKPKGEDWSRDEGEEIKTAELIKGGK